MEGFTPNPVMGSTNTPNNEERGGMGALIGSIIVIVILIFGGVYFWGQNVNENKGLENATTTDSISDIEADLSATVLDSLDAELNQSLDAEL